MAATILAAGCLRAVPPEEVPPLPPLLFSRRETTAAAIRFLERRVKSDPEDFLAQNRLADSYLERLRHKGNHADILRARRAIEASMAIVPEDRNPGALFLLARVEAASHDFSASRDISEKLVGRGQTGAHQLLGDALLELGLYQEARRAYGEMFRLAESTFPTESRLARLAWLEGKGGEARRRYEKALRWVRSSRPAAREDIAWCLGQLGELDFAEGRYPGAERRLREAVEIDPESAPLHASLGRALAAQGDIARAIAAFERAAANDPAPAVLAGLADLYELAGRREEAVSTLDRIERSSDQPLAELDNRQIALILADHDRKPQEAFERALREFHRRKDIYGADALAWTALKAGHLDSAREAARQALRLGTPDAKLLYHAGMIAHASGDRALARRHLAGALGLSPRFDLRQAPIARRNLAELRSPR
jgi:tetratricopeptide (TPR) repeat protein